MTHAAACLLPRLAMGTIDTMLGTILGQSSAVSGSDGRRRTVRGMLAGALRGPK